MSSSGYVMGRLKQLEINRYGRHALAKLISEHRTTNCRELEPLERQALADLLAEIETELDGDGAAF